MEKPLKLRLLYTANIRGDIHLLPRLFTHLQRLKPAARQGTLLFDLGNACAEAVWHCRLTQGRSTFILLDGMGYHAVNASELGAAARAKLAAQTTLALVSPQQGWHYQIPPLSDPSITAGIQPSDPAARLQICLSPAAATRIVGNVLHLQDVAAGQVGCVDIDLRTRPRITASRVHPLPAKTPPNPSLAAAADFVESEARYFHKKQSLGTER